jgi:plastocyanin
MATVTINSDLSANPSTVTIKGGETVTWIGDSEFAIHLPAPYTNPHVSPNGGRFSGTSGAFPPQSQRYTVHYTVTSGGQSHDPDIDIIP